MFCPLRDRFSSTYKQLIIVGGGSSTFLFGLYERISMDTLAELLEDELKDIFNAENQLIKALPKMAKKATSPKLKQAFTSHLKETEGHVQRLEKVGQSLGIKLTGKKCHAMEGLVEESKEVIEEDGQGAVIDAALIGAAQRVEHYEMAAYGTVRAIAEKLGHKDVARLLEQTLDEESAADKKLTSIAEDEVLSAAQDAGSEEADEE
jgi:ferritin-like metal-binding protein YciE